jgi:multicomponent Na+:H+ antiporter subunit D
MALAGLPPLNGFISKLAVVQSGATISQWLPLGLAVASGAITLMYVFRTWQRVFQHRHDSSLTILSYGDGFLAPALLIIICVVLGFYASPLVSLAQHAAAQISDPSIYIRAVNLFGG